MAILQILNQAKGPLPLKATFNAPSDGPTYFTLAGSVWSSTANQMIGVSLEIDGKTIGSAEIYSNGVSEHRAMVPVQITTTLTIGAHTLTLVPLNAATISDFNDVYNVSLFF
jgi:hypothetical protein